MTMQILIGILPFESDLAELDSNVYTKKVSLDCT